MSRVSNNPELDVTIPDGASTPAGSRDTGPNDELPLAETAAPDPSHLLDSGPGSPSAVPAPHVGGTVPSSDGIAVSSPLGGLDSDLRLLAATIDVDALETRPDDALCGRTMQHFHIIELLGEGGMGRVYRAHDLSLDRQVALKVMVLRDAPQQTVERFIREARAQASITHPNVVGIYYIGVQEGYYFFAMELVEGSSLEDIVEEKTTPLGWEEAIEMLLQVSEGLQHAHAAGFVHRDIKPANLLRTEQGIVQIADFGLAKPLAPSASGDSQAGMFAGTPLYASPEQAQGLPTDLRSDVYSLGATFHHLLRGEPPFSGSSAIDVIHKHIHEPPPRLHSLRPDIPAKLADVVDRMMAKDPAARFESYDELQAALNAAKPPKLRPAGFMVRSIAMLIDGLLAAGIPSALVGPSGLFVLPIYMSLCWTRFGRTLGQLLFDLQVARVPHGERLGHGRAALRALLVLLGPILLAVVSFLAGEQGTIQLDQEGRPLLTLTYGLVFFGWLGGLFVAAFRSKRALHDRVVGSMVVYQHRQVEPKNKQARSTVKR